MVWQWERLPGVSTDCRNLKGLQKGGLICYSLPGQGQWGRRGGCGSKSVCEE